MRRRKFEGSEPDVTHEGQGGETTKIVPARPRYSLACSTRSRTRSISPAI